MEATYYLLADALIVKSFSICKIFSFLSFCLTASWRSKYKFMPHYTIRPNDVGYFIAIGVITWLYCTADCIIHIAAGFKNLPIASSKYWLPFVSKCIYKSNFTN